MHYLYTCFFRNFLFFLTFCIYVLLIIIINQYYSITIIINQMNYFQFMIVNLPWLRLLAIIEIAWQKGVETTDINIDVILRKYSSSRFAIIKNSFRIDLHKHNLLRRVIGCYIINFKTFLRVRRFSWMCKAGSLERN